MVDYLFTNLFVEKKYMIIYFLRFFKIKIEMVQEGLGLHMEWYHQFLIMVLHPQFSINPLGSTHFLIQRMGNFYVMIIFMLSLLFSTNIFISILCPFL